MKHVWIAPLILFSAAPLANAAPPATASTPATACSITVDVTDEDPKGVNVRATPGGKVIAALVNSADWIEVHVTAQTGDWYEIDRANQIDNENTGGDIVLWHGRGYVHKSVVGVSGLIFGADIYADHDMKSRKLFANVDGDQRTDLLGCWKDFYKVHIKQGTGWTKEVCTNQNTTCS
jgi:hypothetical protein